MLETKNQSEIQPALYIGLMSGTSIDGIDSVIALIGPTHFEIINNDSIPFPAATKAKLAELCHAQNASINEMGSLNTECGRLLGHAVKTLLKKSQISADDICAIGSHGQTIRHAPKTANPFSIQLGDASVIAEECGITTISDFRMADIASGGHGAPLVPAFHHAVFRSEKSHRAIINIGGISNITLLPQDSNADVTGYDIGPGNTLMDQWTLNKTGKPFDDNGAWAKSGQVDTALLEATLSEPYFTANGPKSTGRELFNLEWLEAQLIKTNAPVTDCDIQATLAELSAITIARAISDSSPHGDILDVYLCGGGVKNSYLVERIQHHTPQIALRTTSSLNMDPQLVEAAAFAWLAYRTYNGLPGNMPCVTGAKKSKVLGGIFRP